MRLIEIRLRSYAVASPSEGALEALDYAVTVTQYGDTDGLYCCAITCLQDGHRVKLKNGRQTFVTGNEEKALAWFGQASGVAV